MRIGVLGSLIARSRRRDETAPVAQLGHQLAGENEEGMAAAAPMIGAVVRRVFDHADADVAGLEGAPDRHAGLTLVLGCRHGVPHGSTERDILDAHCLLDLPQMARRFRSPPAARGGWSGGRSPA